MNLKGALISIVWTHQTSWEGRPIDWFSCLFWFVVVLPSLYASAMVIVWTVHSFFGMYFKFRWNSWIFFSFPQHFRWIFLMKNEQHVNRKRRGGSDCWRRAWLAHKSPPETGKSFILWWCSSLSIRFWLPKEEEEEEGAKGGKKRLIMIIKLLSR